MSAEPLMDVREAAAVLGYSSEWPIRRLIKSGQLRAHKIQGRIKISREAIDELLEATEIPRDTPPASAPAASAPAARRARRDAAGSASSAPWERRRARGTR